MEINGPLREVGAFIRVTKESIKNSAIYNLSVNYEIGKDPAKAFFHSDYDAAFSDKRNWKRGNLVSYREWLTESGFPYSLYKENGFSLSKLVKDERVWKVKHQSKNQGHSFFGFMCKPLDLGEGKKKSYMEYMLERLRRKDQRSYPHFYFDINPAAWIWEELMRNEEQIKSYRGSATCCTNFWVRWDKITGKPRFGWIFKHAIWTHLYQDIFGLSLIGQAIAKELGFGEEEVFDANVFFISFFMDEPKRAKSLIYGG